MTHLKLPVVITPTRSELGARCHRRHFLGDVMSRAKYLSPSLEFGSIIHAGVAAHWLGQDWHKVLSDEWVKRFETEQNGHLPSQESVSLNLANAMLEHYVENAQIAGPFTQSGEWKRVDVEQRFEIPLRQHMLSFQCDRMVYNKEENWLVVVDTKTAARLDAKWERQWETAIQMKLYKMGVQRIFETGGRVDIVVEGLLKHVPSDIRYYVCPEWSDMMLAEAAFNASVIADLDEQVIAAGHVPSMVVPAGVEGTKAEMDLVLDEKRVEEIAVRMTPVNYFDCFSYGIECPFRQICTADVDQRVDILRGEYFEKDQEDY